MLDCRNDYESAVGAFATATALNTSTFRDTWSALDGALAGVDKSKPVLMYCTGGIRCVKAGAYVRQALGFEIYQLLKEDPECPIDEIIEERFPGKDPTKWDFSSFVRSAPSAPAAKAGRKRKAPLTEASNKK